MRHGWIVSVVGLWCFQVSEVVVVVADEAREERPRREWASSPSQQHERSIPDRGFVGGGGERRRRAEARPILPRDDDDDDDDEDTPGGSVASLRSQFREMQERVEFLEEQLRATTLPSPDEEQSLLETFSGAFTDFVMTKLLPRSQPECRFHYAKAVCVPKCKCEMRYKLGDLTPSRACRAVERRDPTCVSDVSEEKGALEKLGDATAETFATVWTQTNSFLREAAPPTDAACDFSWRDLRCAPADRCAFKFRFGDYHLGRACRATTLNIQDSSKKPRENSFDDDDDDERLRLLKRPAVETQSAAAEQQHHSLQRQQFRAREDDDDRDFREETRESRDGTRDRSAYLSDADESRRRRRDWRDEPSRQRRRYDDDDDDVEEAEDRRDGGVAETPHHPRSDEAPSVPPPPPAPERWSLEEEEEEEDAWAFKETASESVDDVDARRTGA